MKKKLEKLMYMGLGALIALGGYFFGTLHSDNIDAQLAPANVEYNAISCRSLKIGDADGNPIILLGSTDKADGLFLSDKNGQLRISLTLDPNTGGTGHIMVSDKNGKHRVTLGTHPDTGTGVITILDENGKPLQFLH